MGMKHRVDHGVHIAFDAMSPQFVKRTGFSDDDTEKIKTVLTKLFEGDASFACPEGNVEVMKLIWLEHNCKAGQYSSTKVHGSLKAIQDTYQIPLFALQHYIFCLHQCALIHNEQAWAENYLTAQGKALHECGWIRAGRKRAWACALSGQCMC